MFFNPLVLSKDVQQTKCHSSVLTCSGIPRKKFSHSLCWGTHWRMDVEKEWPIIQVSLLEMQSCINLLMPEFQCSSAGNTGDFLICFVSGKGFTPYPSYPISHCVADNSLKLMAIILAQALRASRLEEWGTTHKTMVTMVSLLEDGKCLQKPSRSRHN